VAAVLLDPDRYDSLVKRLDYLEDSVAALRARRERESAMLWADVRE
jgi:hypothetical protein